MVFNHTKAGFRPACRADFSEHAFLERLREPHHPRESRSARKQTGYCTGSVPLLRGGGRDNPKWVADAAALNDRLLAHPLLDYYRNRMNVY